MRRCTQALADAQALFAAPRARMDRHDPIEVAARALGMRHERNRRTRDRCPAAEPRALPRSADVAAVSDAKQRRGRGEGLGRSRQSSPGHQDVNAATPARSRSAPPRLDRDHVETAPPSATSSGRPTSGAPPRTMTVRVSRQRPSRSHTTTGASDSLAKRRVVAAAHDLLVRLDLIRRQRDSCAARRRTAGRRSRARRRRPDRRRRRRVRARRSGRRVLHDDARGRRERSGHRRRCAVAIAGSSSATTTVLARSMPASSSVCWRAESPRSTGRPSRLRLVGAARAERGDHEGNRAIPCSTRTSCRAASP